MSKVLENLIKQLSELPGIGPKSAQRLSFHIMKEDTEKVRALIMALVDAKNKLHFCSECGAFTENEVCDVCSDENRNKQIICVVQEPNDVLTLERTREFKGLYHVLGGVISPMNGIGPDQIRVAELIQRLQRSEEVQEVILATNPTIEGESTAMYLSNLLQNTGIQVSRLAYGLPVGGNLDFADDITLSRALERRHSI